MARRARMLLGVVALGGWLLLLAVTKLNIVVIGVGFLIVLSLSDSPPEQRM